MARNIRWTVPFFSLGGTSCRVDIYSEGWTGGVTTLKGCAVPFEWEEDNDEDLLNVVRYKTGYLRVIEESYDELAALYPQQPTDRYVKFYYGSSLVFTGYIQAQSFSNPWVEAPRELELPVVSPLGLAAGMFFEKRNPTFTSLLTFLREAIGNLKADYTGIIFPDSMSALAGKINSLVVSPFGDFPQVGSSVWADIYDPIDCETFIEGLCHAFGCIVHDSPTRLIFSKFDHSGSYLEYSVSGSESPSSVPSQDYGMRQVSGFFTHRDTESTLNTILPLKRLTLNFNGDRPGSTSFNLSHAINRGYTSDFPSEAIWLKEVGNDIAGTLLLDSNSFGQDHLPANAGLNICYAGGADGHIENERTDKRASKAERILMKYSKTWSESQTLFTCRFNEHPFGNCFLHMKMSWGTEIATLGNDELGKDIVLAVTVQVGSNAPQTFSNFTINKTTGEGGFGTSLDITDASPVIVTVALSPQYTYDLGEEVVKKVLGWRTSLVYSFDDINIQQASNGLDKYYNAQTNSRTIDGSAGSLEEGSVDMLMSNEYRNSNLITHQGATFVDNYPYLFRTMHALAARFAPTQNILPVPVYLAKWQYWITGWRWRIIACGMNPIDDEYTLTLHHSTTID